MVFANRNRVCPPMCKCAANCETLFSVKCVNQKNPESGQARARSSTSLAEVVRQLKVPRQGNQIRSGITHVWSARSSPPLLAEGVPSPYAFVLDETFSQQFF